MTRKLNRTCDGSHDHERLAGSYKGRSITSSAEEYPEALCRVLANSMGPYQPTKAYHEAKKAGEAAMVAAVGSRKKEGETEGVRPDSGYGENDPFKPKPVTDSKLIDMLNKIEVPVDLLPSALPLEVQADLLKWSGLEVTRVISGKSPKTLLRKKAYDHATLRTDLVRSNSVWYYVTYVRRSRRRGRGFL